MTEPRRQTFSPTRASFPDDFPRRIERLRESSGLSWPGFARALGVSVRTVHRWRRGGRPDAAHLLALLDYAAESGTLSHALERPDTSEEPQGVLFDEVAWERMRGGGDGAVKWAA